MLWPTEGRTTCTSGSGPPGMLCLVASSIQKIRKHKGKWGKSLPLCCTTKVRHPSKPHSLDHVHVMISSPSNPHKQTDFTLNSVAEQHNSDPCQHEDRHQLSITTQHTQKPLHPAQVQPLNSRPSQQLTMCSGVSPARPSLARALASAPRSIRSSTRSRHPGPASVK